MPGGINFFFNYLTPSSPMIIGHGQKERRADHESKIHGSAAAAFVKGKGVTDEAAAPRNFDYYIFCGSQNLLGPRVDQDSDDVNKTRQRVSGNDSRPSYSEVIPGCRRECVDFSAKFSKFYYFANSDHNRSNNYFVIHH